MINLLAGRLRPALLATAGVTALAAPAAALAQDHSAPTTVAPLVVTSGNAVVRLGKIDQAIRDIPQSVTQVARDEIELTGANTLDEVLLLTPGLTLFGANEATYYVRGFQIDAIQFDGVPISIYSGAMSPPDTALYDSVEVLRGAAGLWQGADSLGGAINLERKRPRAEFGGSARASIGSWETYRAEGDVTGPIGASGAVRGRLVAAYEDRGSFIDYVTGDKTVIYGALDADLGASTTLSAAVAYQDVGDVPFPDALPRYSNGQKLALPRSTFLGAAWNQRNVESTQVFADLTHRFENGWKLRLAANYLDSERTSKAVQSSGAVNPATGMGPNGLLAANKLSTEQWSLDAGASGPFSLFGRTHEIQVGGSWRDEDRSLLNGRSPIGPINVFTWNPGAIAQPADPVLDASEVGDTKQYGVFAAARLSLTDDVTLILGGRQSWWETKVDTAFTSFGFFETAEYDVDGEFTPYAGLTWAIDDTWSAYASYAQSFQAQNARTVTGAFIDPLEGVNLEAGVKAAFNDGRLIASLAIFRLDQKNRAKQDPQNPCATAAIPDWCSIAEGKVRSQGVEAELTGRLTPAWLISASYTFNETEYLRDRTATGAPTANQGAVFSRFTPKHIFRVWTNYRLPGHLSAVSVGGGLNAQSRWTQGSGAAAWSQPAYALLSGYVGYDITPQATLSLNVNNITDETYFEAMSSTAFGNRYGAPRNATVSLRARF